jgi:PHO85 cyclin-5
VFIQETIRRSRTSFSTLQLALYYLLRIKSSVFEFEKQNPEWFSGPCNFGKTASKHPIACGRRMFLAAVIVASKYLQDRNYSNRAWAKISGLPVKEINANEFVFLNVCRYELYVGEALYKRWSLVLLNHVMAIVSVSTVAATSQTNFGLNTPPLTPIISPTKMSPPTFPVTNPFRISLAQRFCEAIRNLSPQLTEQELSSLHVLGFQSTQQKPMSPPPSRSGPLFQQQQQRQNNPVVAGNPFISQTRFPSYEALTPPSSASSDSGSDSELWSPKSNVSSASSNDSTSISPRANIGRCYLKSLSCSAPSTNISGIAQQQCLSKRTASPLSIIAACNDRRSSISDSPLSMEDVRPTMPPTPRLRNESTPSSAIDCEDTPFGTIDPQLLQLNSSALNAVKGLCSLSQRATVFPGGAKRQFAKSYSMDVQSEFEACKRRRGVISNQTLARIL